MKHYHLAQLNIGRVLGPIGSPIMAGFVAQLEEINALAEATPGFVWRLQGDTGDATDYRPYADDPTMLMNMSVWESVESLRDYVYKSAHRGPLQDRLKWFERPTKPHLVLWWVPAGHIPSIDEAVKRVDFRHAHGDTAAAFSFSKVFPPPDEPACEAVTPPVNFDNRQLISAANTANADCSPGTRFFYRQHGVRVWATYEGERVLFGSLVAVGDREGRLDMRYHHVDAAGTLRTGKCQATPEVLPGGRLRLHEEWQRTNEDFSVGRSIVEEVIRF